MKQIHKDYDRAFLLEPTKLNRLMGTIHERLADHQASIPHDSFEVFLAGDRREEMTNVDDVLKLENLPKRKIQRLLIVSSASTESAARPEHEVHVDFGSRRGDTTTGDMKKTVVAISVRSDDAGWADRTLSELEEQVERTWLPYTSHILTVIGILLLLMFLLVGNVWQLDAKRIQSQVGVSTMWLHGSDLERVQELTRDEHTLTDQEVREVVTRQLRNVLAAEQPQQSTVSGIRQTLFIATPLVAILACIIILFSTCYPRAVFLWGDEDKRWASTLRRRNIVWGVIGSILVGGLLASPFFEGVIGLFPSK